MNLKGFIIYSPLFCRNSAGVYCLYKIAKDIQDAGYTAMITLWGTNQVCQPVYDVPIVPNFIAQEFIKSGGYVVLYPEVITGNPLKSKNVIRLVMDIPGKQGGESVYDSNELVFAYSKNLLSHIQNKVSGIVELPTIDTNLFYFDGKVKTDITVYIGKKSFISGYIDHYDNIITRTSPARDEVAKIMRRTKILYTFDPFTIVIHEALLCGANVVILDNDTNINFSNHELGNVGIHLSKDNINLIDSIVISNAVLKKLEELKANYAQQLKEMIRITQDSIK